MPCSQRPQLFWQLSEGGEVLTIRVISSNQVFLFCLEYAFPYPLLQKELDFLDLIVKHQNDDRVPFWSLREVMKIIYSLEDLQTQT